MMLDRFEQFFAAVNDGAAPYPWQRELVRQIAESGRWPGAISMPTGAGKSSVVDMHVFLVAERARDSRIARPPRRLVLVAPRRALVEDQFERAARLSEMLGDRRAEPIVREVASALSGLVTGEQGPSPLGVARLRGGVRLDLSWRLDPTRCQVVCATPQMWGSRLLLRGFRGSPRARNLEAGLLGHDAAVVIDEAHLNERLVATSRRVADNGAGGLGLQVVAISATRAEPSAVELTAADLDDSGLAKRVRAAKRVTVVPVDEWRTGAPEALVEQARRLAPAGTVGVFVNTVAMALDVAERLDGEAVVVCGRMRPADLDHLRERHEGLLTPRGNARVNYLVSTQSLEVGVDLDLPAMVSTVASASALAQRAGRLNRSGRYEDAEFVVVVPREPAVDRPFPPYAGDEIDDAVRWLETLGGVASPERITASTLPVKPRPALPGMTSVELETLGLAGIELAADLNVDFYVNEPVTTDVATVSIGAREHLDRPDEMVRAVLLAAPPRPHELAEIAVGTQLERVLNACKRVWVMRGVETVEPLADPSGLAPGDVVVVEAGSPVLTRGVIGLPGRRSGGPIADVMHLRADGPPDVVVELEVPVVEPLLAEDPTLGGRTARDALAELVIEPALAGRLRRRLADLDVHWYREEGAETGLLVVVSTAREGALPRTAMRERVALDAHCAAVRERMGEIVDRLDTTEEDLGASLEQLLAAAWWHDRGKIHPRFQARMGAASGEPVAKPVPGHYADRGDGWRHEQLSAAYAWARCERDPLITVIDGAHHGHGMPLFDRDPYDLLLGWEPEPDVRVAVEELFGSFGRFELERARLERSLGLHRLSHLQALLRCADMQISQEGR